MNTSRPHLLGLMAGLFLAAGLVLCAILLTRTWLRVAESQTVTVTGSARKAVRSDLVIWRGFFSADGDSLLSAQRALKTDLDKVQAFLTSKQVTNYVVTPISIQELRGKEKLTGDILQDKTIGFKLSQSVEVRSSNADRIAELSRESSALIERGVVFTTSAPEYIYTKAGEAKIEMLAEATKDARARAQQIASQGGRLLDQLRSAKMGVFQITPLHSIQTSWEGMNDNTSLEKTITAVITATFSLR
jgi:uncharacterized protein